MKNLFTTLLLSVIFTLSSFGQVDTLAYRFEVFQNAHFSHTVSYDSSYIYFKVYSAILGPEPRLFIDGVEINLPGLFNIGSLGVYEDTIIVYNGELVEFDMTNPNGSRFLLDVYEKEIVDTSSNIGLFENNIELDIYPNPTTDVLNIKGSDSFNTTEFKIFNLNGQLVKSGVYDNKIYVSDLSTGVYLLHLVVDGKPLTNKFIKK